MSYTNYIMTRSYCFPYDEGLKLFSLLMNIFIALELIETLKNYLIKGTIQVQFILIIGLIAVSRKLIITEFADEHGLKNIGMGLNNNFFSSRMLPDK